MTIKEQKDKLAKEFATKQSTQNPTPLQQTQKNSTSAIDIDDDTNNSLMPEAFKNHFLLIEMKITEMQNKLSQVDETLWNQNEMDTPEALEIRDLLSQYRDFLILCKKCIKPICIIIGGCLCLITLKILF